MTRQLRLLTIVLFFIAALNVYAADFKLRDGRGATAMRVDAQGNAWLAGALQQNQALGSGATAKGWTVRSGAEQCAWLGLQLGTWPAGTLRLGGVIHPLTNIATITDPGYIVRGAGSPLAVFESDGDLSLAGRIFENANPIDDCRADAGVVQFALAKFETEEGVASAQILVARTGGVVGAVTVHYQTADGSAQAGEDYVVTAGTLTLADGEESGSFEVQIENNAAVEGTEYLWLELSGAQGGCRLGAVRRAQLVIHELPPEPAEVAGAIDGSVPTKTQTAAKFLYEPLAGQRPIQTGVTAGAIDDARAAVIHGTVYGRDGESSAPLAGVTISILEHPELGQTLSRANGSFDMVVNGGGTVGVCFEKAGWLKVCRRVPVKSNEWCNLEAVRMTDKARRYHYIDLLNNVSPTIVDLEEVNDADGQRQGRLLFLPGTQAELVPAGNDAETTPVNGFNIYFNEYTVGDNGQAAMPADLDPAVAYTYCFEIGVLEAEATGAPMLHFDRPVIYYVNNFLNYPVGMNAPSGTFYREGLKPPGESDSRGSGQWSAEPNGRVIKLLSINNGVTPPQAVLDVNGHGQAATAQELANFGIDTAELEKLAEIYSGGDVFWRIPLTHFTFPKDINWPLFFFPQFIWSGAAFCDLTDLTPRDLILTLLFGPEIRDVINGWGSLDVPRQVMGESVGVAGTPFTLNWSSDRAAGYKGGRRITVPILADEVPPDLAGVQIVVKIGGRLIKNHVSPPFTPNQSWSFTWDGNDAWGRPLEGWRKAKVSVGWEWPGYYGNSPGSFAQYQAAYNFIFGLPSDPELFDPQNAPNGAGVVLRSRTQSSWRHFDVLVGPADKSDCGWYVNGQGLGGWTLNVHHGYDPEAGQLLMGDGRRLDTKGFNALGYERIISGFDLVCEFGMQLPYTGFSGMDVGPDGSLYVTDSGANVLWRIKHADRDSHEEYEQFAGTGEGTGDYSTGDGGFARDAQLIGVKDVAVAPDGTIYVTQGVTVRRIDRHGIIQTVAGGGSWQSSDPDTYNGRRARDVRFGGLNHSDISRIAVGADGSLYILQWVNVIFRVAPDGRIYHYAGDATYLAAAHEDVPATKSYIGAQDIAIGPDGSLYLVEIYRIRHIDNTGIVRTVAGGLIGSSPTGGDGSPANQTRIAWGRLLEVADDGTIYFMQGPEEGNWLRTVTPGGKVFTIAGNGALGYGGDGGPALKAGLGIRACGLALDRKGTVYLADRSRMEWPRYTDVARIKPAMPAIDSGDILVPDSDAGTIYEFNEQGRHLATLDAMTYQPVLSFDYDTSGRLTSVTDHFQNVTLIERDAAGAPQAIVAPWGQRTSLTLDEAARLSAVELPGGRRTTFAYGAGDMLTTVTGPRANAYGFDYDEDGLLVLARDPVGGATGFKRAGIQAGNKASGHAVVTTTSLGVSRAHAVMKQPDGTIIQVLTDPDDTITTKTWRKDFSGTIASSDGTVQDFESGPSARTDMGLLYPIQTLSRLRTAGLETLTTHSQYVNYQDYDTHPWDFEQTDYFLTDGKLSSTTIGRPDDDGFREITAVTPAGRTSRSVVDERSCPVLAETPGLATQFYEYDSAGRLTNTISGEGAGARSIEYEYNSAGLPWRVTDPLGRQSINEFNAADQLTTQTLPGGRRVGYEYDASGNLIALAPPGRPVYRFEFSPRSELVASHAPEGVANSPSITYEYDLDRRATRTVLPGGDEIRYGYDAAGRLSTTQTPRALLRNRYDALGRLASFGDGATTYTYSYNQSLPVVVAIDGPLTGKVTTVWGAGIRCVATKLCDGTSTFTLGFAEDDDDLPTHIGRLSLEYDSSNGLLTKTHVGDTESSVSTQYGCNEFGEPISISTNWHDDNDDADLYDANLTRDKLGRITVATEWVSGGGSSERHYFYDEGGRLRATSDGPTTLSTYTYDLNGNRLARSTASEGTVSYTYDVLDRLTDDSRGTHWDYNANGQLTTRTLGAARTVYNYDATGALLGVRLPDGRQIDYTIDPLGNRIERKVDGARTDAWLYSGGTAPVARMENGRVRDLYVYGIHDHVPEYLVRYASDGTSTTWRIVTDQRASVRLVVNTANGAIGQRLEYDDFGRVTTDTNPGFQPFGFAGGLYDAATGLVRFGARDYDPEIGRWTTLDPIGFDGGLNLYGYVLNDPINYLDPSGFGPQATQASVDGYIGWGAQVICDLFGAGNYVDWSNPNQAFGAYWGSISAFGIKSALASLICPNPRITNWKLFNARQMGKAAEEAVGITGPKVSFRVPGTNKLRIPEEIANNILKEVKNVKKQCFTSQLRDYLAHAQAKGFEFHLYVRPTTKLSGPLWDQINAGAIKRFLIGQ